MRDYAESHSGRTMEVRWVARGDTPVQAQGFYCDDEGTMLWFPEVVGYSISRSSTYDTRAEAKAAIRSRLFREAREIFAAIDKLNREVENCTDLTCDNCSLCKAYDRYREQQGA